MSGESAFISSRIFRKRVNKTRRMVSPAPWVPTDFAGLAAWYDISDYGSFVSDSANRVSLLSDKSGNSGAGSATSSGLIVTGQSGAFASAPDSAALSITGSIDIRFDSACASWTASQWFVAKDNNSTQRSYSVLGNANGAISLIISTNGSTTRSATSSVAYPFSANQRGCVRITYESANGAVNFYSRTDSNLNNSDGWSSVGVQQSVASGAIFDGTSIFTVGSLASGSGAIGAITFYRVQIRDGINGTVAFDANFVGQRCNAGSFTESSVNAATVTINGAALLGWLDSSNCLVLNGVTGNYASAPDSAAVSVTGDIDLRIQVSMANYLPSTNQALIGKFTATSQRSFWFTINTSGQLALDSSVNGTATSYATSSVVTGLPANSKNWLRVTRSAASGNVNFYTSQNGTNWTLLGNPNISSTSGNLFDSTTALEIGALISGGNSPFSGRIYRAQILNGINGTIAFDANFSLAPKLATSFTESSVNAATVTINTSGATGARISGERDLYQGTVANQPIYLPYSGSKYAYLNGTAGNFLSAPDSTALDITGDIDVRSSVTLFDWTPSLPQSIAAKWNDGGNQRSWLFQVSSTGALILYVSTDGATTSGPYTSTAVVSAPDLTNAWIRFTRVSATGVITFFTSTDGTTWTQLGTTVAGVSGAIFNSTALQTIGAHLNVGSGNPVSGRIFRAQIYNGINGTLAFDFNAQNYSTGSTLLDASANAATITINGGATIVTAPALYFDGTNDFLKAPPFALSQPETVQFVGGQVTWTQPDTIYDGNDSGAMSLTQAGSSPSLRLFVNPTASNVDFGAQPLKTRSLVSAVFNGATSFGRTNKNTGTTGTLGTTAANGFNIGCRSAVDRHANITTNEIAIYNSAQSTAQLDQFANYAGSKWGFTV